MNTKVKVVLCSVRNTAMVMRYNGNVWASEGIAPHSLNLGNRWS
jgi:hypothetical protein